MRPRERRDSGQNDLFKARLDQIVDLNHPLAKLARTVDWRFLEERFGAAYSDGIGPVAVADRGYRGHNAPPDHRFKVYISGQKRRVTEHIKRELRRRSAVEPVIGHAKGEHRMGRNYLAGQQGDAINVVLAAAGYNFRRLLA